MSNLLFIDHFFFETVAYSFDTTLLEEDWCDSQYGSAKK